MSAHAAPDDLTARLAAVIDRYCFAGGIHGPYDAATRVLAEPAIRDGIQALTILEALHAEHQPRRWSDDSDAATCTCGAGYPCSVQQTLTQATQ